MKARACGMVAARLRPFPMDADDHGSARGRFGRTTPHLTCRRGHRLMVNWLFRNRQTGKITIAQSPNAPLIVFLVTVAVRWIFRPPGTVGTIVSVVAAVALIAWAGDEVVRGV